MAAKLTFTFALDRNSSVVAPACRIWVDVRRTSNINDDTNVDLVAAPDGIVWRGEIALADDRAEGIFFQVAYRGTPGAQCSLRVVADKPTDHVVWQDHGVVTQLEDDFWGRCGA